MDEKKLATLLAEMESVLTLQEGESPVIFIGPTRVGKSATLNQLFGGETRVIKEKGLTSFTVEGPFSVGKQAISHTLYPQVKNIPKMTLAICDVGGFGDTRGEEEKTCVSGSLQKLINVSTSVRGLVIVIDWSMLTDQSIARFLLLASDIAKYLTVPTQLTQDGKNAISFVITKIPETTSKEEVDAHVAIFKEWVEDNRPMNPEAGALIDLMTEGNTFLIRRDARGFLPGKQESVTREENCAHLLAHLESLPLQSFPKGSLQPAPTIKNDLDNAKAFLDLQKLANQPPHTTFKALLPIKNEIQKLATHLINISDGKASSYSIDDMSRSLIHRAPPLGCLAADTFRNITETQKSLFELKRAAQVRFRDNTRHEILNQGLKELRLLQTALNHRINTVTESAMHGDLTLITEALLPSIQSESASLSAHLKTLNTEDARLKEEHAKEIKNLEAALETANAAVSGINSKGEPALSSSTRPAEPTVSRNPGTMSFPGPRPWRPEHPATGYHACEMWTENRFGYGGPVNVPGARETYEKWERDMAAYNAWVPAANRYLHEKAIHDAWRIEAANYDVSSQKRENHRLELKSAQKAVVAAQDALNNRKELSKRDTKTKAAEITTAKEKLAASEVLRLRLTGAIRSLNHAVLSQHRSIAIQAYETLTHSLIPYANNLPKNALTLFQKTLDGLKVEELDTLALEKIAEGFSEDRISVELSVDTLQNQLEWIKENSKTVQSITLRDAPPDTPLSALSLRLSKCCALNTLVLDHVGYNEENFGDLLVCLENMPELSVLDLRNNALKDAAGIQLLGCILIHPGLLDVKLEGNNISPIVLSMINTVLSLKQSETLQSDGSLQSALWNLLFAQELLEKDHVSPKHFPEKLKYAPLMHDLLKIGKAPDGGKLPVEEASESEDAGPETAAAPAGSSSSRGTFFYHGKAPQPSNTEHKVQFAPGKQT